MKYLFILISLASCSIHKKTNNTYSKTISLKEDINSSIIDGFFGGDTTKIPKNTYLLN